MNNERKIFRYDVDSPFLEVGPKHIKIGYDQDNFILINTGGITRQGQMNVQGSPSDTNYYGLFHPQNEWAGAFTAGMISAPQYVPSTKMLELIPGIMALVANMSFVAGL